MKYEVFETQYQCTFNFLICPICDKNACLNTLSLPLTLFLSLTHSLYRSTKVTRREIRYLTSLQELAPFFRPSAVRLSTTTTVTPLDVGAPMFSYQLKTDSWNRVSPVRYVCVCVCCARACHVSTTKPTNRTQSRWFLTSTLQTTFYDLTTTNSVVFVRLNRAVITLGSGRGLGLFVTRARTMRDPLRVLLRI